MKSENAKPNLKESLPTRALLAANAIASTLHSALCNMHSAFPPSFDPTYRSTAPVVSISSLVSGRGRGPSSISVTGNFASRSNLIAAAIDGGERFAVGTQNASRCTGSFSGGRMPGGRQRVNGRHTAD